MRHDHEVRWLDVVGLASGNPLRVARHKVSGGPGPTAAIVATVHGDESIAIETVRRVLGKLQEGPLHGTVLALPVMNPLAFESYSRHTWIDAMNLNRVFPGRANGSVSEQIAQVIHQHVLVESDALIDLHNGNHQFVCDYSYAIGDPEFARYFGSSAVIPRPSIGGSSAQQMVDAGKVAVIAEFGGGLYEDEAYIEKGVAGTWNALRHLGMVEGEATLRTDQVVSGRMDLIRPRQGGLLVPSLRPDALGRTVPEGTELGSILNPHTFEVLETFVTPFASNRVTLVAAPYVRMHPGDFAYMVVDAN